jgi:hypothetical protein
MTNALMHCRIELRLILLNGRESRLRTRFSRVSRPGFPTSLSATGWLVLPCCTPITRPLRVGDPMHVRMAPDVDYERLAGDRRSPAPIVRGTRRAARRLLKRKPLVALEEYAEERRRFIRDADDLSSLPGDRI